MRDGHEHTEGSHIRDLRNGGDTLYEKAALSVAILAMALVIAHTLYVFRFRYHEMAFDLYYLWTKRFSSGINPWLARPHCLYPPAFLILLSPLTRLSQQSAYWIWQAVQVGAFFLSVFIMLREIAPLTVARLTVVLGILALLLPYIFTSTLYESEPSALGRIHARVGNGIENLSGRRRRLFSFSAPLCDRPVGDGVDTDPRASHRSEALD